MKDNTSVQELEPGRHDEKTFMQIVLMCVGFFGIQFGWGLQMGNMSSIYSRLGADPAAIPMLWLAAPITGLIIQPLVGFFSDRTWCSLGRRRPYFLGGAIFSTLALIFMPLSTAVWMAALCLWILDASVNISMEPFRAFVGDLLPSQQRKVGYAMQSVMIGAGGVIASFMPTILTKMGVSTATTAASPIPATVRYAFFIGAIVLITAIVATVSTTKEYPPENMEEFKKMKEQSFSPSKALKEMGSAFVTMPETMKRLAVVQFFTWAAFDLLWVYFAPGIADGIFHAAKGTHEFELASNWASDCFGIYNAVAFGFSFVLLWLAKKFSAKGIHVSCLIIGGLGLASLALQFCGVDLGKYGLVPAMVCVGIAWSSILSMPYALLSNAIPAAKMGFYMGVFNFCIVIPQIFVDITGGWFMKHCLGGSPLAAVAFGGLCLIIAAFFMKFVKDNTVKEEAAA